jgi:TolB-like protein
VSESRERTIPGRLIVLPMLVFAAAVISIAVYWLFSHPLRTPAPPPSIAVLPFDSPDKALGEHAAEGVMQELTGIPGFEVVPRDQSFPAKGADVRVIGERLNVRSVLDGSVEQADGRVRASAHLINTSDAFEFWKKNFEAPDLATLDSQIARAVMETLGLKKVSGKQN